MNNNNSSNPSGSNQPAGNGGWASAPLTEQQLAQTEWGRSQLQEALSWQENSTHSVIVQNLAQQGVWLSGHQRNVIEQLEREAEERVDANRAAWLRMNRRRRVVFVDSESMLRDLLDYLSTLDHTRPRVVVDCEGLNFKRTGTIDILELFVRPQGLLYLVNVVALKKFTWTITATNSTFCLGSFLSSPLHGKIMWDPRMDAHILNKLYGIRLAGIVDASLWVVADRTLRPGTNLHRRMNVEAACREYLTGRIEPIELNCLDAAKKARINLPHRPWAIRPLPLVLIDYAADVEYMAMFIDILSPRFQNQPALIAEIERHTEKELEIASDPFWPYNREGNAASPWTPHYFEDAQELTEQRRQLAAYKARFGPRVQTFIMAVGKTGRAMTTSALQWIRHPSSILTRDTPATES